MQYVFHLRQKEIRLFRVSLVRLMPVLEKAKLCHYPQCQDHDQRIADEGLKTHGLVTYKPYLTRL